MIINDLGYIVIIDDKGTKNEQSLKSKNLQRELIDKYGAVITNEYESIFYGFAYHLGDNSQFVSQSENFINSVQGITVEKDQIVKIM